MPLNKKPRSGNRFAKSVADGPTGQAKRQLGRPEQKVCPNHIDASPEELARALMLGPPTKDWRYLRKTEE